ncbi:predicted protein [Postia placenta Mad-698-R]|uniref:Uncharacterized protein n=1 Tax=Postia placenta MAD-698-R-SB12 TaxID=670580 RepID=A0A1X6N4D9_9APHY|nr:hypothetical protein POSPLADRAFT_1138984 [Postia placenta MAD-698-R-SB12]EED84869.1 predicted protein [Postia placenta Mad-698-R]OSX63464.1 hypothetical protein POSPLADRAFT_1138984 [Postia placenta MAD-698-R-SB12]
MTQSGDNTEVYSYLSRPRAPLKSDMKAFAVVMTDSPAIKSHTIAKDLCVHICVPSCKLKELLLKSILVHSQFIDIKHCVARNCRKARPLDDTRPANFTWNIHRVWWTGPLSIARNQKEELNMPSLGMKQKISRKGHCPGANAVAISNAARKCACTRTFVHDSAVSKLSTPSRPSRHAGYAHQPQNSSPLASSIPSSPTSSPGAEASARRRSQYKSHALSSPTATRTRRRVTLGDLSAPRFGPDDTPAKAEEAPRKTVLRERLRARCLERALRDRERKIAGRRHARSEASSDGDDDIMEDDDDDEEEDDEAVINDERGTGTDWRRRRTQLFRRLIANGRRKQQHQYRLSYAYDVGSSFDPDMEDINEWEQGPLDPPPISTTPEDLDEEELAAYAEEAALLEDLRPEDLYSLSDLDAWDVPEAPLPPLPHDKGKGRELPPTTDGDVDMTTS